MSILLNIAKIAVGATALVAGQELARRDVVVRVNGKPVSNDTKEAISLISVCAGVVFITNGVGNLLK